MEKIYEQTLLYDFYGELLTEHQRSIYEDAVYNDMSLGEIAEMRGISRQGVHDLIKRCDKILQDYEAKLHLLERFADAKAKLSEIEELTRLEQGTDAIGKAQKSADAGEHGQSAVTCDNADLTRRMERIRELAGQMQQDL
ncbi:MAG: YlxM family DNA-binding protein [Muribaculum sp.]|nr:YlxM family DNA-binding protein [Muribaculum sp.]